MLVWKQTYRPYNYTIHRYVYGAKQSTPVDE